MKRALVILVLLAAGATIAHLHVSAQTYHPVVRLASSDGFTFSVVQDAVRERGACGEANDRFLGPVKERCKDCKILYARCERELQGLEADLLARRPVAQYLVAAPALRIALEGPAERLKQTCEEMAAGVVRAGLASAACVYPESSNPATAPVK